MTNDSSRLNNTYNYCFDKVFKIIWLSWEKKKNCPDFPPLPCDNFYIAILLSGGLKNVEILLNPSHFMSVLNILGQYDVI